MRAGEPFKVALFADLHFGEDAWTDWGPLQDVNSINVMNTVLHHETPGQSPSLRFLNLMVTFKVLIKGPLPRKRPRQKGIGSGRYRFSSFSHSEQKLRRNAVTAVTKHRYGRKNMPFMTLDIESAYFFQLR